MSALKPALALLTVATLLGGCNAGAIVLGAMSQRVLTGTTASGQLTNAPPATKVGYLAWIELQNDGTVKGRLNFDLVSNKNVSFDKIVTPANGKFSVDVSPSADLAEGTYVVFAWDDKDGNGAFDGDKDEKRAPEVYRLRGQAATRSLWTAEKFVFTQSKLAIEYALLEGGLSFSF